MEYLNFRTERGQKSFEERKSKERVTNRRIRRRYPETFSRFLETGKEKRGTAEYNFRIITRNLHFELNQREEKGLTLRQVG